ncbi:MAG: autotransporter-associated beta strand repeat-containing protein [Lentimonas sp.]
MKTMIKKSIKTPEMKANGPLLLSLLLAATASVSAQSTWSGATDTIWSTAGNWDALPSDNDSLIFSGTTGQTNANDTLSSVTDVTFTSQGWTLTDTTGSPLTLKGNILWNSSTGGNGNNVWGIDTDLAAGVHEVTVNNGAGGTLEMSGVLSGSGGIIRGAGGSADGTLYLSNTANTFTGDVVLDGGTTQVGSFANEGLASSLGAGTGVDSITLGGSESATAATLSYVGSGNASTDRQFEVRYRRDAANARAQVISNDSADNSDLTFTAANGTWNWTTAATAASSLLEFTLSGTSTGTTTFTNSLIEDAGATDRTKFVVNTAGTVVLNAANSYTAGTDIQDGILQLNNAASAGTGAIDVQDNNGQLLLNGGINVTNALTLSGKGSGITGDSVNLALASSGGAANEYSGDITIGGTEVSMGNVSGSDSSLTVSGGIDLNGNKLSLRGNAQDMTLSGKITGTGTGLIVNSTTANVTISNNTNDFDAPINLSVVRNLKYTSISNVGGGASALGAATTVENGTINIDNGNSFTRLDYIGTADASTDRVLHLDGIGGDIILVNSSTSPTKLTFTGDISRDAAQTGGLVLQPNSGNTIEFSGVLSDDGSANRLKNRSTSSGTVILSGDNTYTGTTIVDASSIMLVNGTTSGQGAFTVAGTLGGNGTIGTDNANVFITGTLSTGNGNSPDTLTMDLGTGSLDVSGADNLIFELGTTSDLVVLTSGSLDLGVGVIGFSDFTFNNIGGFTEGEYALFDTDSAIIGSLDAGDLSGFINGLESTLSLSGNNFLVTVVPEPSAYVLLGGLCALVFVMMRRRK